MRSKALVLIALVALIGNAFGQTSGKVPQRIDAMPACAGYDADLAGCPTYPKATACTVFTADGAIAPDAGQLISVVITNASANDDVLIYDNPSAASGTVIANFLNVAAGATVVPFFPAPFSTGAYLDLTTAGAMNVNVCYSN